VERALAIVNPVSGRGAGQRTWQRVRTLADWECAATAWPGHARELARRAANDGYARVIAVGGDGTVSEVVNGLAGSSVALGIIRAGTGNDIANNLGIPRDPHAAAALATTASPSMLDLCEIETPTRKGYFVNIAGFGFDAEVAWRVNRMRKLPGATLPYVAGVLQTLWRYASPRVRLTLDNRHVEQDVFLVAVGNCPTYGGGMRIVPGARPDDGLFEVCIVKDLKRLEVLRILPSLYSGGHVNHPAVEIVRCRTISADADGRVRCQADGELVGELPARFRVHPAALRCATGLASGSSS
jgi:diacylglycerol kinase (ATP)